MSTYHLVSFLLILLINASITWWWWNEKYFSFLSFITQSKHVYEKEFEYYTCPHKIKVAYESQMYFAIFTYNQTSHTLYFVCILSSYAYYTINANKKKVISIYTEN